MRRRRVIAGFAAPLLAPWARGTARKRGGVGSAEVHRGHDGAAPSVRFAATSPRGAGQARRCDRQGGFTLVEALVAFAIIAVAAIVLQRGLVQSRLGLAVAADREAAEWVARDLLATPLTLADMQGGGRTGTAGGRRYEIRLTPLDLPMPDAPPPDAAAKDQKAAPPGPSLRWVPMREQIKVEIAGANTLAIETVKLGPVAQAQR